MKKRFISSFVEAKFLIARCLTLLILALLSTNLAWGEDYTLFTGSSIETGDYILVGYQTSSEKYYAMNNTCTNSQYMGITEVSPSNDEISTDNSAIVWTISASTNGYYITNNSKYLDDNATSSKNYVQIVNNASSTSEWTFTYSNNLWSITNIGNSSEKKTLSFNIGSSRVACYKAIQSGNTCFYLFKKQADVPVTGVTLNKNELPLNVGATETLTATVAPDDATNKNVTWSSDKEGVATVSESGVVTAVAAGTATITATSVADETISASCVVTVSLNKLATPTNLNATPASTSATLSWDVVENASSYEVNVTDAGTYNEKFYPTTNSLLVEGLTANTEYLWSVKAIGDNTTYANSDENSDGDFTTLPPPSVAYTVSFDGNSHGTPASASITENPAGSGVTLPDCTPNEGYQFVGWATTNTATEVDAGVAGATYYPTANITLYAVYNKVFTITWSVNGTPTTDGDPTTSVVEGDGITALPTAPADISGMKFQGWTAAQIAESSATKPADLFTDAEHAPAITANTTFYAVFAEEGEGEVTWTEITSAPEAGTYAILTADYFMKAEISSSRFANGSEPKISNNKLTTAPAEDCIWEISKPDTHYRIKNGSNYAGGTNNKNQGALLTDANADLAKWTIEYNNGFTIVNYGRSIATSDSNNKYLRNNGTNGWATYASNTGSAPKLFKKTQAITYTYYTNVVVKQLTSIELSGEYPTEFWRGGTFNHDGITVTAHYSNADDEDVTNKATFTGYDMAIVGEQIVTVTYEGKTATYDITVKTIANTAATAYTVAEAKAIIDAGKDLGTEVYVKGTVSKIVTAWDSQYNNITYNISEDGETTSQQFQLYRCETNGAVAGDYVIAKGTMKKFGETYEFNAGNTIVNAANMTITAAKWGTFCAPFDVTIPEGVKAYTATADGNNVAFAEVTTTIPASTPVVVYSANLINKNYFGALADTKETCQKGALVGVYAAKSGITAEANYTNYVLQNNGGVVGFYKATSTISLKANRCYMTLPTSSAAKDGFTFEEIITGISEILNPTKKSVEGIFDLNGRKLAAPQKGINIINGVKVIVK